MRVQASEQARSCRKHSPSSRLDKCVWEMLDIDEGQTMRDKNFLNAGMGVLFSNDRLHSAPSLPEEDGP